MTPARALRVGIDATPAVTQGAGIGRYTRELLLALAALDTSTDYRLIFAASAASLKHPLPPLPPNFHTRRLPVHDIWLARLWHRARVPLPADWLTGPIDLFHSPDFTLPPVTARTRTLLTVHDLSFVRDPNSAVDVLRTYLNRVVPRSVARADHVLANSQATRADLMALYGTPAEKITVLYSGVNARFRPVTDAAALRAVRARYGLGDGPLVLAVGTLQPRKNYVRLIQAFARLPPTLADVRLVLAGGRGWLFDAIFAEVDRLGLRDRVLFPGFTDDADLPALYSAARVLAYPSLYEGFGLPILEAFACGTPVVASTASCLPEVAGDAALLVDPTDVDALAAALHHRPHRRHPPRHPDPPRHMPRRRSLPGRRRRGRYAQSTSTSLRRGGPCLPSQHSEEGGRPGCCQNPARPSRLQNPFRPLTPTSPSPSLQYHLASSMAVAPSTPGQALPALVAKRRVCLPWSSPNRPGLLIPPPPPWSSPKPRSPSHPAAGLARALTTNTSARHLSTSPGVLVVLIPPPRISLDVTPYLVQARLAPNHFLVIVALPQPPPKLWPPAQPHPFNVPRGGQRLKAMDHVWQRHPAPQPTGHVAICLV